MNNYEVFPIRLYANELHSYADSPALARSIWVRHQRSRSWYAADCSILDANTVEVYVYDIECSFRGGIGKELYRFTETNLTAEERIWVDNTIRKRQIQIAADEWDRRKREQENAEIEQIRKELFPDG